MLTEDKIKFEIVRCSMEHLNEIYEGFVFESDVEVEKLFIKNSATMPANWVKVNSEDTLNGDIEVIFDCEPLDDQLRAYVLLNKAQTEILSIEVIGE